MMMARKSIKILTVLVFTLLSYVAGAEHHEKTESGGQIDTPEEIKAYIKHHLQDSHDFTLYTDGATGHHVGFPLPVIIWDEGLHTFMSSAFHHGEEVVESNGKFYTLHHGKIYRTDAEGTIDMNEHHHASNVKPFDLSITKSVFGMPSELLLPIILLHTPYERLRFLVLLLL